MSLILSARGLARRNAPLLLLILALPLSLLTQCSGSSAEPVAATGGCNTGGCKADVSPIQSCSAAADCELPRSTCSNQTTLAFYTSASCDGGMCRWLQSSMSCPAGCINGGCQLSTTTTSSLPPMGGRGGGGQSGAGGGGQSGGGAQSDPGGGGSPAIDAGAGGQSLAGASPCVASSGAAGTCDAP